MNGISALLRVSENLPLSALHRGKVQGKAGSPQPGKGPSPEPGHAGPGRPYITHRPQATTSVTLPEGLTCIKNHDTMSETQKWQ